MNDRTSELLAIRSGLLLFILMLVATLSLPLSVLPGVTTGPLIIFLAGGILPAACLFWVLGGEITADKRRLESQPRLAYLERLGISPERDAHAAP